MDKNRSQPDREVHPPGSTRQPPTKRQPSCNRHGKYATLSVLIGRGAETKTDRSVGRQEDGPDAEKRTTSLRGQRSPPFVDTTGMRTDFKESSATVTNPAPTATV